jgi:LmbE family N-acetylglucosaminyl deacetylase
MVTSLGLPDGLVEQHLEQLDAIIGDQTRDADLVLAPWSHDGHPDHDACGAATARVTAGTGVRRLDYLVWAWHWADPGADDIPWADCRRLDLDAVTHARKWWSTRAYRSQIRPSRAPAPGPPVLQRPVLARLRRRVEVFVDGDAG